MNFHLTNDVLGEFLIPLINSCYNVT